MPLQNPVSTLNQYCSKNKLVLPTFEQDERTTGTQNFQFTLTLHDGKKYGPYLGSSKSEAKMKAAAFVCDAFNLQHSGIPEKTKKAELNAAQRKGRNFVGLLHEYCQTNGWVTPLEALVTETGQPHDKLFEIRYTIAGFKFPSAIGRSKELAKRRSAARALSILKKKKLREYMRGPDPDQPFGNQVTEFAWETFGILCEEFGESIESSMASNLSAFLLEDVKDGSLKCVAIGTGKGVAEPSFRTCEGETVIDCHSVVVARRCLLVFFYKQLCKLFKGKKSIFKYQNDEENDKIAVLRETYRIHLYMKEIPCGAASLNKVKDDNDDDDNDDTKDKDFVEIRDHKFQKMNQNEKELMQISTVKSEKIDESDIASCSDKILLWNHVGLQGALLGNIIKPVFIDSITVTEKFVPSSLAHAFCCRYENENIEHPWMQSGTIEKIENLEDNVGKNNDVSMYWTHGDTGLNEEVDNMLHHGGMLDGHKGSHCTGTERYGEIPMISKRYLFMMFKETLVATGDGNTDFLSQRRYKELKGRNVEYRKKKNSFFKHLQEKELGSYPIVSEKVDDFTLDE